MTSLDLIQSILAEDPISPGGRLAMSTVERLASLVPEWRGIESAPKEQWIICWDGHESKPMFWNPRDPDFPSEYEGWCYPDHMWGGTLYDGYNEVRTQPTLWQPLPEAPKETR